MKSTCPPHLLSNPRNLIINTNSHFSNNSTKYLPFSTLRTIKSHRRTFSFEHRLHCLTQSQPQMLYPSPSLCPAFQLFYNRPYIVPFSPPSHFFPPHLTLPSKSISPSQTYILTDSSINPIRHFDEMVCSTRATFHHACTHVSVLVTHTLTCQSSSPCSSTSSSTTYIVNGLCPWCTGELEIPHGPLPVFEERVKIERRKVYEAVVRMQMVECEGREMGGDVVRLR